MGTLTEKTFFYYAKCPKWVQRDLVHKVPLDDLEHQLIDDGLLPDVVEGLLAARGSYETVQDEDANDAFERTLDLMRQGVQTIYRGVFVDGHWVARPDVLERVEGKSQLGDYYYVAVDVKRLSDPRSIREGHRLQGAFYAELLFRLQGVRPTSGYIMSPTGVVMRYDLEKFEADFHLSLQQIEAILAGDEPEHILTSGCKASPYFAVCVDEADDCDDLSLLNRIHAHEVQELNDAGITTVLDLATTALPELYPKLLDLDEERVQFLHRQAVALKERVHDVVEVMEFEKASVELYFDIEADPLRDLDYLFGVLKVVHKDDGSTDESYHAFVAEDDSLEQERAAWEAFVAFLDEHRTAPVYHYGWYEISVCAKLIERYGAPEGAVESWRERFIDLNAKLRSKIIFPLSFYSLKDLAQYIGFNWRSEEASGLNSVRWFHDWLRTQDRSILERIVQYNEDDVRATYVLKEWLEKQTPRV